jgi:hypothetical protein
MLLFQNYPGSGKEHACALCLLFSHLKLPKLPENPTL